MLIKNLPYAAYANVLAYARDERCELNVTWTKEGRNGRLTIRGVLRYSAELDPNETTRRRAALSGYRTCGVTWDAHRGFMMRLFDRYPDAVIMTALATYNGRDEFMAKYPATADHNVGSKANPVRFASL